MVIPVNKEVLPHIVAYLGRGYQEWCTKQPRTRSTPSWRGA